MTALGGKLGYEGKDLSDFVLDQQAKARDERTDARSHESDLKDKECKYDLEMRQMDFNNLQANRTHELELARIHAARPQSLNLTSTEYSVEKPKLPIYEETEDLSSYFTRFERICRLLGVPNESLAVRLGTLLRGKAAELYSSLPSDITDNYFELKSALLLGFNKTADTYRSEFRGAKCTDETYVQFINGSGRKFDYWLNPSSVTEENL